MDKQTGYKTKCMLTYPMVVEKECIGVVMALNKIGAPAFTAEDEQVKMFIPSLEGSVVPFYSRMLNIKTLSSLNAERNKLLKEFCTDAWCFFSSA